jgi:hypothetical protein
MIVHPTLHISEAKDHPAISITSGATKGYSSHYNTQFKYNGQQETHSSMGIQPQSLIFVSRLV